MAIRSLLLDRRQGGEIFVQLCGDRKSAFESIIPEELHLQKVERFEQIPWAGDVLMYTRPDGLTYYCCVGKIGCGENNLDPEALDEANFFKTDEQRKKWKKDQDKIKVRITSIHLSW